MAMSPAGLGPENDCSVEGQQQLQTTDPSSRQRGRPTSINPQLSDSNKNVVLAPDGCLTPRQIGRLTFGRNITFTLT
jgi:hypothetical protein